MRQAYVRELKPYSVDGLAGEFGHGHRENVAIQSRS